MIVWNVNVQVHFVLINHHIDFVIVEIFYLYHLLHIYIYQ